MRFARFVRESAAAASTSSACDAASYREGFSPGWSSNHFSAMRSGAGCGSSQTFMLGTNLIRSKGMKEHRLPPGLRLQEGTFLSGRLPDVYFGIAREGPAHEGGILRGRPVGLVQQLPARAW